VRANSSLQQGVRLGGKHPEGKVTVDRLWRGANLLTVIPKDETFEHQGPITIDVGDGDPAAVRVELMRRIDLVVRVLRHDGQPSVGSRVELLDPNGHTVEPMSYVADPKRVFSSGRLPWVLHLASAEADRLGFATLRMPPDAETLAVRVTGKGHAPVVHAELNVAKVPPMLELIVPQPSRIRGKLVPTDLLKVDGVKILVLAAGMDRGNTLHVPSAVPAADGTFAIDHLPSGDLQVALVYDWRVRMGAGGGGGSRAEIRERIDVSLAAGKTSEVTIDAKQLTPSRVRGRVLRGDGKPAKGSVSLTVSGGAGDGWSIGYFTLDADGRFTVEAALPGHYVLTLVDRDPRLNTDLARGRQADPTAAETLELAPAADVEKVFHVQ
jgi:hypothetical protein